MDRSNHISITGTATIESLQDSPQRTKASMNNAIDHIASLLADLEEYDTDHGEMKRVHDKVDELLGQTVDQRYELSEDLSALYAAVRKGHMTPSQLETMVVSEQEKSIFILKLSSTINSHLQELCVYLKEMADHAHSGGAISGEYLESLGQQIEIVTAQVGNVTAIASSPPKRFKAEIPPLHTFISDHADNMKRMKQDFEEIAKKVGGKPHPIRFGQNATHNLPVSHATKRRPSSAQQPVPDVHIHVQHAVKVDAHCQTNFDAEPNVHHHHQDEDYLEEKILTLIPRDHSHQANDHKKGGSRHPDHKSSSKDKHHLTHGQADSEDTHHGKTANKGNHGLQSHAAGSTHRAHSPQLHEASPVRDAHLIPTTYDDKSQHDAIEAATLDMIRPESRPMSTLSDLPDGEWNTSENGKETVENVVTTGHENNLHENENHEQESSQVHSVPATPRVSTVVSSRRGSLDKLTEKDRHAGIGKVKSDPSGEFASSRNRNREGPSAEELALRAKEAERLRQAKYTISTLEKKLKDYERQIQELEEKHSSEITARDRMIDEAHSRINASLDNNSMLERNHNDDNLANAVDSSQQSIEALNRSKLDGEGNQASKQQSMHRNSNAAAYFDSGSSLYSDRDPEETASFGSDDLASMGNKALRLLQAARVKEEVPDPSLKQYVIVGDSYKSLDSLVSINYIANNSTSVVSKVTAPKIVTVNGASSQLNYVHYSDSLDDSASGSIKLYSPGTSIINFDSSEMVINTKQQQNLDERIIIPSIAKTSLTSSYEYSAIRAQSAGGGKRAISATSRRNSASIPRPYSSNPRNNMDHLSARRFESTPKGVLNAYLAADREVAILRNKDSKWDEAKSILRNGIGCDQECITDDFEVYLSEGILSNQFANAKIIIPRIVYRSNKQGNVIMDDEIGNTRPGSPTLARNNSPRALPGATIPLSGSTHYKPTDQDINSIVPIVTKLGVPSMPIEFDAEIQTSDRPLFLLFKKYKPFLPDNARSSMIRAMFHELIHSNGVNSPAPKDVANPKDAIANSKLPLYFPKGKEFINDFFHECLDMISRLNSKAGNCLEAIQVCEQSVTVLISLANESSCHPDLFNRSLAAAYKKLGTVGALKLQMSLELAEFRSFFENILALPASVSVTMIKQCPEFKKSYDIFVDTQCLLVESSDRFSRLKTTCRQEKLFSKSKDTDFIDDAYIICDDPDRTSTSALLEYPISPVVSPHKETLLSSKKKGFSKDEMKISVDRSRPSSGIATKKLEVETHENSRNDKPQNIPKYQHKSSPAKRIEVVVPELDPVKAITDLKRKIDIMEEELNDAKVAIINLMHEKDLTPGSLIFYSVLADPISIITFKNLHKVISDMKEFIQNAAHFDYAKVRMKLMECVSAVPVLDRFIGRYSDLHKKWCEKRSAEFSKRGLQGGNADGSFCCPICHVDARTFHQSQRQLSTNTEIHGMFPRKNKTVQKLRDDITSARLPPGSRPRSAATLIVKEIDDSNEKTTLRVPSAIFEDDVSLQSGASRSPINFH